VTWRRGFGLAAFLLAYVFDTSYVLPRPYCEREACVRVA